MTSKFALVIANTEYQDTSFAKLTAPGKDAEEFAEILRDPNLAAFNDVQVLINEGEGKTRRTIARFFVEHQRDDLLLLYFSGHGIRNEQGQLFLAAYDTEINILEATGIRAEFITYAMNNSRSQRQLLVLDCCNSGAFAYGSKSASAVGKSMGMASAFEGSGYGRVVLTATDATQYAWEGDKVIGGTQKSVFTHFLIEGLKGEADRDGDGRISIDELYDYTHEQVVRRTPKQTPGKWSYKQQGDIILRDNLKIRDVKPAPLPSDLLDLLSHSNTTVRKVGIQDLISLLDGKHLGLARGAEEKLREISANDDSLGLRRIASDTLISHGLSLDQPLTVETLKEEPREEISTPSPREIPKQEKPVVKQPRIVTPPISPEKKPVLNINFRLLGLAGIIVAGLIFIILGGNYLIQNWPTSSTPNSTSHSLATEPPSTKVPTETPTEGAAYEGLKVEAPNCDYGGEFKSIEAVDKFTVKMMLCVPDPSFPSKIAFSSFAIQPVEHLESTGGKPLENPIGTGPYKIESWERGNQLVFTRFDDYWGGPPVNQTLVFRWGTESAQRLLELQSGTVDGIDNVAPDDFATVERDSNLQLLVRPALNIFYIGFNNNPQVQGFDNTTNPFTSEKVRQAIAMGIDRQRIVDNFYPSGSEVASHFTPCSIPNGCVGEEWYTFDPEAAQALLAEAGYPDGFETVLNYRDVVRGFLPDPNIVAQDIQAQLQENLNITLNIEKMESSVFLDAAYFGQLTGIYLHGWGADYPDQTNFLGYHFGAGAPAQFGDKFEDITSALASAAQLASDEERRPFYEAANNAIKQHVPMIPVAHGGSALAFKATVEGAHASPLGNENFAVIGIPDQDTFVWMQNAEPISLYCSDETDGESLRACEQVSQSLLGYKVGGTAVEPALAESYESNDDFTEWTFHLRQGVLFHDGSSLDANDVVTSLALQWDAAHPLHTGNTGAFSYWYGLFGAFLNAPPQ